MNVTETKSEGLSREFRVSVPKGDLAAKFAEKINELQPKMNMKGFRPGKVPAAHIKKMYGKSIMADIVNDLVQETSDKALAEKAISANRLVRRMIGRRCPKRSASAPQRYGPTSRINIICDISRPMSQAENESDCR